MHNEDHYFLFHDLFLLFLDNVLNERRATVEIIDKKDEADKSAGTAVILNSKKIK
ncbi:MAG TPA: hypothetical protein VN958_07925 [Chitinophagaceae bacterium]|nr:hypothetical protein [Chitinophagaceae bacterium]